MTFEDSSKDTPEYEAFTAALRIAERETTATMNRVARAYEADDRKQSQTEGQPNTPSDK